MSNTKLKTKDLISNKGNHKLGKVYTFSLPAIKTCPGATKFCKSICYATQGFYKFGNVVKSLEDSYKDSLKDDFHLTVVEQLKTVKKGSKFRIHPSGDFYNLEYLQKWYYIIRNSKHITFWFYTRSFNIPGFIGIFDKIVRLSNVQVWFSCDKDTVMPRRLPKGVRLAYVMADEYDIPLYYTPHLYFRDHPFRKDVRKTVQGILVCPPENGVSKSVTCDKCGICFSNPDKNPEKRTQREIKDSVKIISLPLIKV